MPPESLPRLSSVHWLAYSDSERPSMAVSPQWLGSEKSAQDALEAGAHVEGPFSRAGESLPPEGIEDHIGHRVSLTGGEDAPLGLVCEDCGEYVIEWDL